MSIPHQFQHIFHSFSIYSLCESIQHHFSMFFPAFGFPLIFPALTRCSFSSNGLKRLPACFFTSCLDMSASHDTVFFDFSDIREVCSVLHRKHISIASRFFCSCFQIVQIFHPYVRMVQYSTPGLFLCESGCIDMLVPISFSGNSFLVVLMQF